MTAGAEPRYATARTPGRPTFGPAVARVAAALGKPLQAWQRQVVDVALELLPDDTGPIVYAGKRWVWAYRTVVIHVQRQAGKTTLIGPVNLHRVLTRPRAKCWLTAQSRQDGRDAWRDVAELVDTSPLAGVLTKRRSNGSEELAAGTGSTFRVFAPSEDALHGKANELVTVDEVWSFDAVEGAALQQAILPTFTTTGGQLWLPSTAGTAESTWLLGYVDRGRAAVSAGVTEGLAYFEWSLTPAAAEQVGQVLTDVARAGGALTPELSTALDQAIATVLAAHPGEYVRPDAVRSAALSDTPGGFLRAFGNVWSLTADRVIADHLWRAGRRQLDQPEPGQLALAYDVSIDRGTAAIGAGWRVGDQRAVDCIDTRPGAGWLVERIEQLALRYRLTEVWYDAAGPSLDIADELRRRGVVTPVPLSTTEAKAACSAYLAAVDTGGLLHRGTDALDQAAAAAARRELGDGWLWSRRRSASSIAPLAATTWALWGVDHAPEPAVKPVVVSTRTRTEPEPAEHPLSARRRILTP